MFVLGFAASSFAIHAEIPAETQAVVSAGATQITIGGEVRIRGIWANNLGDLNSDKTSTGDTAKWDQRVRLQVEAKVTPNTTGLIQLEAGDPSLGSNTQADIRNWGTETSGATGTLGFANGKQDGMRVLQAWILHQGSGLLGVPALVKIGHMPIQIGQAGLFYEHTKFGDDALLLGVDPIKGLHLIAGTVKMFEGNTALNDDVNAYTFIVSYDVNKDINFGADLTYADGQNLGHGGSFGAIINDPSLHLWNLGANAKVRVAGLGIAADVAVQRAKVDNLAASFTGDDKFTTFATKVDLDFTIKPVTLLAGAAYGSGNNNASALGRKDFITSQSNIQHFTFVYEYLMPNAAGNTSGGLQNTWYLMAGAKADIVKNLDVAFKVYYLRAINGVSKEFGVASQNTDPTGLGNSKNIGTEIDGNINYQIDRNLKYYVEGGYLFAGNFGKSLTPGSNISLPVSTTNHHASPDDAWAIRHGIQLSF